MHYVLPLLTIAAAVVGNYGIAVALTRAERWISDTLSR